MIGLKVYLCQPHSGELGATKMMTWHSKGSSDDVNGHPVSQS